MFVLQILSYITHFKCNKLNIYSLDIFVGYEITGIWFLEHMDLCGELNSTYSELSNV